MLVKLPTQRAVAWFFSSAVASFNSHSWRRRPQTWLTNRVTLRPQRRQTAMQFSARALSVRPLKNMRALIENVIDQALAAAKQRNIAVYTFALYYDHESPAISVCIDTEEQSKATVSRINTYNRKYFIPAVAAGDLQGALLWLSNTGRSLSLGDFHSVNLARADLSADFSPDQNFFVSLVQALAAAEAKIALQAAAPQSLLLCCSGSKSEVEYWWSVA